MSARWKWTLDLTPDYADAKGKPEALRPLAGTISTRLLALKMSNHPAEDGRDELVDMFGEMAADESLDVEDFDNAMSDLYDWADRYRVWVDTIMRLSRSSANAQGETP